MLSVAFCLLAMPSDKAVAFSFVAPEAKQVFLAGSFNGWKADATPMVRVGDRWTATVHIPYGKALYKFVVDGRDWRTDPAAKTETDPSGNVNSVMVVVPPDYAAPARKDDGIVAESALKYEPAAPFLNYDQGRLTLTLRARPNDLAKIEAQVGGAKAEMKPVSEDELYAFYRASVPYRLDKPTTYRFLLSDGKRTRTFGDYRLDPKTFKPFLVPDWVERGVIYQIFPDRFENGDRTNDPSDVVAWDAKPTWFNFFGGDAAGIDKRIPYLKSLGVGAVYLNPIFRSPSNHRYDADDFRAVDPRFGSNADVKEMTAELRANGIRTILDFAFNHTSPGFFAFEDLLKRQSESRYKDWYFVHRYPVKVEMPPNYEGWWGFSGMPKLNARNPEVRDYLLATAKYWVQDMGIDGMRLDVPNEVDESLWKAMRPLVKQANPNEWIVGEIWDDGGPWLKGDQFDSVMNYPFRTACIRFVAEGSEPPSKFAERLSANYARYAPQVSRNLMNLLSSHDTERFLTLCGGNRDLAKLAATIQFTWVGTPSVYYGEEVGMEGGKDPDNRGAMRWDLASPTNDLLTHYRRLIALRNGSRALQSGEPTILLADDAARTFAFARTFDRDVAIVVVNRDSTPHTISLNLPKGSAYANAERQGFVDPLSGRPVRAKGSRVSFDLGPTQAAVLLPAHATSLHSAHSGLTVRTLASIRSHQ